MQLFNRTKWILSCCVCEQLVLRMMLFVGSLLVLGSLQVSAEILPFQGSNLQRCATSMQTPKALEERLRICKLRRDRSLLFSGEARCAQAMADKSMQNCDISDAASASGSEVEHTPSAGLIAPAVRDNLGQIYAGYGFWFKSKKHRITKEYKIQSWRNNQWQNMCQMDLANVSCLYEMGQNRIPFRERHRRPDASRCSHYSLSFYPVSTYMNIVETTSHVDSGPPRASPSGTFYVYTCKTQDNSFRKGWIQNIQ